MTLVVDASVLAEMLVGSTVGHAAWQQWGGEEFIAHQHLPAEIAHVVRNLSLGHLITDAEAMRILSDFRAFKVELYPVEPLMVDAWEMRHNVSAYDALYVVLARLLGACLLTCDRRLAVAAPDVAVVPTT